MLAAILFLFSACSGDAPGTETGLLDALSTTATQARYTLAWDTEGVEVADGSWSVETDLGYQVTLSRGYLSTYSLYLIPCPEADHARRWSLIRAAHAGHSLTEDDSMLLSPQLEDIAAMDASEHDSVLFDETEYCEVSYVTARADDRSEGMPDDLDLRNVTLYLEGQLSAPGEAPAAFQWSTALFYGRSEHIVLAGDGDRAHVRVERQLSTMFDGVDFADVSEARAMDLVLQNLINHTTFTTDLEPRRGDSP